MSYASGLARALRALYRATACPSRLPTMPQHSFGASSRAWATIWSSSERAIRKRSGALGGLQRGDLVLVVVLGVAADGVLELPHPVADRLAHLGQALRAEDDEGDDEHDHELERTDVEWHESARPFEWVQAPGYRLSGRFRMPMSEVRPRARRGSPRDAARRRPSRWPRSGARRAPGGAGRAAGARRSRRPRARPAVPTPAPARRGAARA